MREEEQVVDIEGDSNEKPEYATIATLALPTSARQSVSRPHSEHATPAPGTPVPSSIGHGERTNPSVNGNGVAAVETVDDDVAWAEEDPDDDVPGWKLKIVMEDDRDFL
jgi:COMPASS component SWD1